MVPRRMAAPAHATRAKDQHRAREHVVANHVPRAPADGDHPAPHRVTNLIADVPLDQNRAAGHSLGGTAIGSAHQMTRIAADVNEALVHFRSHPTVRIALHQDFASGHLAADVAACGTMNVNPAAAHPSPIQCMPERFPSISNRLSPASPVTANISANGIFRLPCNISNRSISASGLSQAQSGVKPSISTGTVVSPR